jgi:magnesium-transporting ATPase (P-type)
MSVVVKGYNNVAGNTVFLKGASDRVLDKCSSINLNGRA